MSDDYGGGCASEGAGDFGRLRIPLVTWNMVTWLQWARTGKLAKSCSIMHVSMCQLLVAAAAGDSDWNTALTLWWGMLGL